MSRIQISNNVLETWRPLLILKLINWIEAFEWSQAVAVDPGVISFIIFSFSALNFALKMIHMILQNEGEDLLSNVKYFVCWVLAAGTACKKLVYTEEGSHY